LAATLSYLDFFAESYGSANLFFITTCFQLQQVSIWLGNSMFWWYHTEQWASTASPSMGS